MEITTSKTGKHGHAKAHIVGLDIFTGKKYEDLCPTSHNMSVPVVNRAEFQVGNLSLARPPTHTHTRTHNPYTQLSSAQPTVRLCGCAVDGRERGGVLHPPA